MCINDSNVYLGSKWSDPPRSLKQITKHVYKNTNMDVGNTLYSVYFEYFWNQKWKLATRARGTNKKKKKKKKKRLKINADAKTVFARKMLFHGDVSQGNSAWRKVLEGISLERKPLASRAREKISLDANLRGHISLSVNPSRGAAFPP